jgi:hypothetical protein
MLHRVTSFSAASLSRFAHLSMMWRLLGDCRFRLRGFVLPDGVVMQVCRED